MQYSVSQQALQNKDYGVYVHLQATEPITASQLELFRGFKIKQTFKIQNLSRYWERATHINCKRQLLSSSLKGLEVCDTGDVAVKAAVKTLLVVHNLDPGHFLIHWSDVQIRTSRGKNLCWRQGVVMQVFIHFRRKIK